MEQEEAKSKTSSATDMTVLLQQQNQILLEMDKNIKRLEKAIAASAKNEQDVAITEVDIPIISMAEFMVKWAIAAIPAGIVIGFFILIGSLVLAACSSAF